MYLSARYPPAQVMRIDYPYRTKRGTDTLTWWWAMIREKGYKSMQPYISWRTFGPNLHALMTRVEKARAWREVQRTQIGMALHRRLGAASPMRVISADMADLISNFL
jgi:hypothetical protein